MALPKASELFPLRTTRQLPRQILRNRVPLPDAVIPSGRMVELPGRGTTYVTDTPGPEPDAPSIVLLHAVGCTGLLTWFPVIEPLSRRYRVVTLDLRWHGRGIQSEEFSLADCADDVASLIDVLGLDRPIIAGYSMGSIIAQRMWRQHPDTVSGLVLAATIGHFRHGTKELLFHQSMELAMGAARERSRTRTVQHAARHATDDLPRADLHDWALREFRSTSPWAVARALAALGRHHSRPWLRDIDLPTAVVITHRDKVLPPRDQVALARSIPGATTHDIDAGHAACVLQADIFVPAFLEAVNTVRARVTDQLRP